jgi:hypothetical protein
MQLVSDRRLVNCRRIEDIPVNGTGGREGTVTVMECEYCHMTHEYFFAPYKRCPHCGRELRAWRGEWEARR